MAHSLPNMRSGLGNATDTYRPQLTHDEIRHAPAIIAVFMEEAVRDAAQFAAHSDSSEVTDVHVIMGLKRQAYVGFGANPQAQQRIAEYSQHVQIDLSGEGDDEEEEEDGEDDTDEEDDVDGNDGSLPVPNLTLVPKQWNDETQSCECNVCTDMREIHTVFWATWKPHTAQERLVKGAIDTAESKSTTL